MKIRFVMMVQRFFGLFGLHVRCLQKGVSLDWSLGEQHRLADPDPNVIVENGAADGRDAEDYAQRCPNARVIATKLC